MNRQDDFKFSSLEEFVAHAQALEQELAERYAEMADCMEVHNNPIVARLFSELAAYGESRAELLLRVMQGREVPRVSPWEYRWLDLVNTGLDACLQQLHYLMTPCHALQLALLIERGAYSFYLRTLEAVPECRIQELAAKMLVDLRHHLALLQAWIHQEQDSLAMTPEDLDPPHMPE
jgi:hypothetical protein